MLFLGTYEHTIDEKNRLVLPSKFVSELSKTVYISKGFDGCLEIREEEDFDKYVKRLLSYSNTSKDARQVQRTFLSLSSKTEIDSAKRILIPSNLRNKANLTKDVVIIGVGKTIEVWDKASFETYSKEAENKYEEAAERLHSSNE